MIDGPLNRVAKTKIFSCPTADKKRQLTVYSNTVDTPAENVMLLPVPHPETVVLETVHKEIFEECDASFSRGRGEFLCESDSSTLTAMSGGYLSIRDHGSYQVVLVPSMEDLDRIPPDFVTLSGGVKDYVRKHYGDGRFGILLCKLKAGAVNYEPFAYSHALLEEGRLFIPTRHYHVHSNTRFHADGREDYFSRGYDFMSSGSGGLATFDSPALTAAATSTAESPNADDWDHDIYTAGTSSVHAHKNSRLFPKSINSIAWARMPAAFQMGTGMPLRCFSRRGEGPNEDLVFPIEGTRTGWFHSIFGTA
jgi:hypothetical protein